MYHPADELVVAELQAHSDERKCLEKMAQAKEKGRLFANLKRQAEMEVLARQRYEAWSQQEPHRVDSLLVRRFDAAKVHSPLKPGPLLYCACCY
jgi:hypothetical protein